MKENEPLTPYTPKLKKLKNKPPIFNLPETEIKENKPPIFNLLETEMKENEPLIFNLVETEMKENEQEQQYINLKYSKEERNRNKLLKYVYDNHQDKFELFFLFYNASKFNNKENYANLPIEKEFNDNKEDYFEDYTNEEEKEFENIYNQILPFHNRSRQKRYQMKISTSNNKFNKRVYKKSRGRKIKRYSSFKEIVNRSFSPKNFVYF
jgi:hypothetical protein